MTDNQESRPDERDPLDELLARAKWPEPTPLQLARLESDWNRARPAVRRAKAWGRLWAGVACAAAVLVLSFAVWKLIPATPGPVDATPVVVDDGTQSPVPPLESSLVKREGVQSRPPTQMELAVLEAAEAAARQERCFRETDPLEQAVTRLLEDPEASVSELVATSDDVGTVARRAVEELPDSRGPRRIALARLLVGIGPPDALPALLGLWTDPTTRDIVQPTVVRLADVPTLGSLIEAEQSFDARVRLLVEIGTRPEQDAQALLIEAATVPFTRPAALAAARQGVPPAELLFRALAHPRAEVRVAAALLLGEHSGSNVTAKLVALARESPNRSEPWIALLQRNDAESRRILEEARQYPQIMASVNTAASTRQSILFPVQVGVQL